MGKDDPDLDSRPANGRIQPDALAPTLGYSRWPLQPIAHALAACSFELCDFSAEFNFEVRRRNDPAFTLRDNCDHSSRYYLCIAQIEAGRPPTFISINERVRPLHFARLKSPDTSWVCPSDILR